MLKRKNCHNCKRRFFAGDEDILFENYYCSFCMPFMRKCAICGNIFKSKSDNLISAGVCVPCREEYRLINSSFVTAWTILRFKVFTHDNFTCRYCGRSPLTDKDVKLHCDHIVPRSKGGEDLIENLVTSCMDCNYGKIDVLLEKDVRTKIIQRKLFG